MIDLEPFSDRDFNEFISWVDSEELLVTIAGYDLSYPLTVSQLRRYLGDPTSYPFRVVDGGTGNTIGHAEIRIMGDKFYKLDKVLIGDPSKRGRGTGLQVIRKLLHYAFATLKGEIVELNVFEWNKAGIRCYEKAGFVFNPDRHHVLRVNDNDWKVLNMVLKREQWDAASGD